MASTPIARLKWLTLWLPVVAVGGLFILEALLDFYIHPFTRADLLYHLLVIVAFTAGAYLFSRFVFGLISQKEAELLRQNLELAALEKRFRSLIENSSDGIAVLSAVGGLLYTSPSTTRILGYATEELAGANIFDLIHPNEREHERSRLAELAHTPGAFTTTSLRIRHKDGSWRWIGIVTGNLLEEPSVRGIICNYRDITERKLAEEALREAHDELGLRVQERTAELVEANEALRAEIAERRRAEEALQSSREHLRALASHLESVREEERRRIAREIHDELGMELTALKMDLAWLANRLPDDQTALREKAKAMSALFDATIKSVRRIVTELRPGVLDDLGLVAAIEWQTGEFQNRTGIPCLFSSTPADLDVDGERSTATFRILQEALTNVVRHASASRVEVGLKEEEDCLVLTVEDNGRGIREGEITSKKSFGILGMQERARLLGGRVTIVGDPAGGTTVTVVIPRHGPLGPIP